MAEVTGISFEMGSFLAGFSRLELVDEGARFELGENAAALPHPEFAAVVDGVRRAMGGGWYRLYGNPGMLDGECWELALCWNGEYVHRYSGRNSFPEGFEEVLGIMEGLGFPEGWGGVCEDAPSELPGEYEHLWLHAASIRDGRDFDGEEYLSEVRSLEDDIALFVDRNPRFCHYYDIIAARGIDLDDVWYGFDASSLDAECVAALVVAAWRSEHFSPGSFYALVDDGTVIRWLERLRDAHLEELTRFKHDESSPAFCYN